MSIKIGASLDSEVCDALMHYADENDLTLPKAINEALSDYFELNEQKVEDEDDTEIVDEDEVDVDIDDDEEIEDEDDHEDDHIE